MNINIYNYLEYIYLPSNKAKTSGFSFLTRWFFHSQWGGSIFSCVNINPIDEINGGCQPTARRWGFSKVAYLIPSNVPLFLHSAPFHIGTKKDTIKEVCDL